MIHSSLSLFPSSGRTVASILKPYGFRKEIVLPAVNVLLLLAKISFKYHDPFDPKPMMPFPSPSLHKPMILFPSPSLHDPPTTTILLIIQASGNGALYAVIASTVVVLTSSIQVLYSKASRSPPSSPPPLPIQYADWDVDQDARRGDDDLTDYPFPPPPPPPSPEIPADEMKPSQPSNWSTFWWIVLILLVSVYTANGKDFIEAMYGIIVDEVDQVYAALASWYSHGYSAASSALAAPHIRRRSMPLSIVGPVDNLAMVCWAGSMPLLSAASVLSRRIIPLSLLAIDNLAGICQAGFTPDISSFIPYLTTIHIPSPYITSSASTFVFESVGGSGSGGWRIALVVVLLSVVWEVQGVVVYSEVIVESVEVEIISELAQRELSHAYIAQVEEAEPMLMIEEKINVVDTAISNPEASLPTASEPSQDVSSDTRIEEIKEAEATLVVKEVEPTPVAQAESSIQVVDTLAQSIWAPSPAPTKKTKSVDTEVRSIWAPSPIVHKEIKEIDIEVRSIWAPSPTVTEEAQTKSIDKEVRSIWAPSPTITEEAREVNTVPSDTKVTKVLDTKSRSIWAPSPTTVEETKVVDTGVRSMWAPSPTAVKKAKVVDKGIRASMWAS